MARPLGMAATSPTPLPARSQVVSFLPVRSAIETEAMQVHLQRVRSSLHSTQPARAATPCLLPLACTGRGMLASTAMAARVEYSTRKATIAFAG